MADDDELSRFKETLGSIIALPPLSQEELRQIAEHRRMGRGAEADAIIAEAKERRLERYREAGRKGGLARGENLRSRTPEERHADAAAKRRAEISALIKPRRSIEPEKEPRLHQKGEGEERWLKRRRKPPPPRPRPRNPKIDAAVRLVMGGMEIWRACQQTGAPKEGTSKRLCDMTKRGEDTGLYVRQTRGRQTGALAEKTAEAVEYIRDLGWTVEEASAKTGVSNQVIYKAFRRMAERGEPLGFYEAAAARARSNGARNRAERERKS